jgi:hypothetical protein
VIYRVVKIKEVFYMNFPNREIVKHLRNKYKKGMRVELIKMDDMQAPPIGTKGTIMGVDDIGSISVRWDNGSGLSIVHGVDKCRIISNKKSNHRH